jgi:hypothetical protein
LFTPGSTSRRFSGLIRIEQLVERVRVFNREPIYGEIPDVNEGLIIGYAAPTWEVWECQITQNLDAQGKTTSTETLG